MNTLIIGSGFGLYGYLPSAFKFSKKIYLNNKYERFIKKRKSLKGYIKKIIWYLDLNSIVSQVDYIIVAQKPKDQHSIVFEILKLIKPKHLFLEKPISNNPKNSLKLIKILNKKKINFSVGYIFKYLSWYKFIKKNLTKKKKFSINWEIKINKKNNLWKYNISEGGGLVRFYAIHLIRLLFDLRFTILKKYFFFSDKLKNDFYINLKLSKVDKFVLTFNDMVYYKSDNPFLKKIDKNNDPRVNIINKYINDIFKDYKTNYIYEKNFILFWEKLEK